ncbi:MAG: FAD-dependent oxidoreductase, partial [Pseudomonadota bacterium]|nr:FAD-dependent oxidoreductase [Pseudomonadota bacterium]
MKIAIIGSGIAGLTCAHLLRRQHQVTVFESASWIG